MKLGVAANFVWFGPAIVELAVKIESLGFESLWLGEHIFLPADIANPVRHGVYLPDNYRHMPDPLISLTAAAVATRELRLGLDVCLVPQRHPLVLAKAVATLDRISGGRVVFGIGTGWIEEEMAIMGFSPRDRWPRTMEYVRALKVLWTEEQASFSGDYIDFPEVYSFPKPLQQPHPPILIGAGNHNTDNTRILNRVAEVGDGWLPVFLSPAQMREQLGELRLLCEARGRDFEALDISLLVPAVNLGVGTLPSFYEGHAPTPAVARELIAEYEAAGVTRILVGLDDMTDREKSFGALEEAARGLGLV